MTLDLDSLADAITPRTRLVACTAASNAVGSMPPVAEVVGLAKAVGALVAIDAVHLAQHHAPDLHGWGADVVATSPYKFFGPHQGMVGVRRELLAGWAPYKLDAAEDVDPHRWQTGTQSHEAMAGTIAAIDYIAAGAEADRREAVRAGFARFHAHERALAARFLEGAADDPGAAAVRDRRPGARGRTHADVRDQARRPAPARHRRGARRPRHLGVGRALLRDRGVRAARAARDRRRRADRVLPLPHARRGRPRAAGALADLA